MSQWNTAFNFKYVCTVWALCSYSSGSMWAHIQAWLQRTDHVLNKCKHATHSLFLLPPGGQKAGSPVKFFVFFRYLIMTIFCSQILTSAEWITGDVTTCVETQSAALSAAARKATSYWPMRGLVKVGSPIEYCLPHRSNKLPCASNTFWLVEVHFCFVWQEHSPKKVLLVASSNLQRSQTRPLWLVCLLYLVVTIAQQELGD